MLFLSTWGGLGRYSALLEVALGSIFAIWGWFWRPFINIFERCLHTLFRVGFSMNSQRFVFLLLSLRRLSA